MADNRLKAFISEIRPNLVYDLFKYAMLGGFSLLVLVVYRFLARVREIPQDHVIDVAIFLGALTLLLGGYYLHSRRNRAGEEPVTTKASGDLPTGRFKLPKALKFGLVIVVIALVSLA